MPTVSTVTFPAAVESYLAGYSSAATVTAYRCDLNLWLPTCSPASSGAPTNT
jgi:hypothetical protein